jgi:hypothetical protein
VVSSAVVLLADGAADPALLGVADPVGAAAAGVEVVDAAAKRQAARDVS